MSIFSKRIEKLKSIMSEKGYNAFYVANITNVRYLSGFTGSSGFLLLTDKSSPESVKFQLQMSKKAFKRAVGSLYKKKKILIIIIKQPV